jgi:acyl-CoA thioesterase FadM
MNLYLRLFVTMAFSRFKGIIAILDEYVTQHRVWPNDLDLLGHMNNGRYFTITDYVRMGMLIRSGILKEMRKRGIYAVIAGETAQFRKPLMPFQKYKIVSRTLGWDERFFYVEHTFTSSGHIHAVLLVKVIVVGPGRQKVSPAEILSYVDNRVEETKVNTVIENWNSSSSDHWVQKRSHSAK